MPENLWPVFDIVPRPLGVKDVLRRAGEGIEERTEGRIRFRVQSHFAEDRAPRYRHTCLLELPGRDFAFFRVVEEGDPYPVTIYGDGEPFEMGVKARDEADLLEKLKALFASEATKKIVFQLLNAVA